MKKTHIQNKLRPNWFDPAMTTEARMKHQARRAKLLIFAGRKDLLNAWVDRYSGDRVKMRQLIDEIR
jgi:hypothetical protein